MLQDSIGPCSMLPGRDTCSDTWGQPLPQGWEKAYDGERNRHFYVDHNTKTTTWLNPLDEHNKPKSASDCMNDELPYGWERIHDPLIGVYYANHLEGRNQWTNPIDDWRVSESSNQHHYSNSQLLSSDKCDSSLDSKHDSSSLLDIMDNCFGRGSNQSVEV